VLREWLKHHGVASLHRGYPEAGAGVSESGRSGVE